MSGHAAVGQVRSGPKHFGRTGLLTYDFTQHIVSSHSCFAILVVACQLIARVINHRLALFYVSNRWFLVEVQSSISSEPGE